MASRKLHLFIRRSHRYLGVVLGIQFLFWTIGGLYFSWTNINEIHGDFQHKNPPQLTYEANLKSPSDVFTNNAISADRIQSLQLLTILNKSYYAIRYYHNGKPADLVADAITGFKRSALTKDEAIQVAAESYNGITKLSKVEYITSVSKHHEYREKPLPAWRITFQHPSDTHIYVSAIQGKVETFRNNKWRIFDFLWMLHTMDYESRDDINNWFLRAFSMFGLITILTGFALFFVSKKKTKKLFTDNSNR